MSEQNSRRWFLTGAAVAAAAPALVCTQTRGTKVNLGWAGLGIRGSVYIKRMMAVAGGDVYVKAICDTYAPRMPKSKDDVTAKQGIAPEAYNDYYKMIADPSIDAVVIMTPEHLHRDMAVAALEAGKHVYCEKPLTHTIEEGFDILRAVEESGKKLQVGTQRRSSLLYKKAKEIHESGVLGKITYARAFWYRNTPLAVPAWRYEIPADSTPENTDYEKFLGAAPKRSFDKARYFQWRLYWDYSGGISTDLLVHQTDAIHMITGRSCCESVMCSGGIHYWTEDDREVPDTITAAFEYPDHFHINYSSMFNNQHYDYGEQLFGSEGTMEIMGLSDLYVYPEKFRDAPKRVASRPELHFNALRDFGENNPTSTHLRNFIDAIKHNAPLACDAKMGHDAAVTGHLATLSFRNEKKVHWDGAAGKYRFA